MVERTRTLDVFCHGLLILGGLLVCLPIYFAFVVGSHTVVISPVDVADGAYVGAGSALTGDVEPGQIAVARGRQRNIDGWVARARPGTATAAAAAEASARHPETEQATTPEGPAQ